MFTPYGCFETCEYILSKINSNMAKIGYKERMRRYQKEQQRKKNLRTSEEEE